MENLQLVDFYEHPLKSKQNFEEAMEVLARSPFSHYMKIYTVPQPGDHPAQFYSRQVVYNALRHLQSIPTSSEGQVAASSTHADAQEESSRLGQNQQQRATATVQPVSSNASSQPHPTEETDIPSLLVSTSQRIGPVHISLNGREEVIIIFHPFFTLINNYMYNGKVLAQRSKPWRGSSLLEVTYGGRTLI